MKSNDKQISYWGFIFKNVQKKDKNNEELPSESVQGPTWETEDLNKKSVH